MPVIGAVAAIGGGLIQASAAKKASRAQERAADQQVALQREIYDGTTARYAPYLGAGNNALGAYLHEMGLGEAPAGYAGFSETPGYKFRFDQGTDAVNALAGARGGLNSGRTMQDLTKFGQGIASEEYGSHLSRLAGLTDMGMGAAGNQAAAGNAFANGAGNAIAARGNATAAGAVGVGNAINGAIGQGMGFYQYQQGLNAGMKPPGWA